MKTTLFARVTLNPREAAAKTLEIPPGQSSLHSGTFAAALDWRDSACSLRVESTDGSPLTHGLCWDFEDWSEEVYVFLPAGGYAGNRFPSRKLPYPPRHPEAFSRTDPNRPLITDVPRLSLEPGPSALQLRSGDLAFPAFGCFDPRSRKAWLVLATKPKEAADWLWEVRENEARDRASFRVSTPALRDSPVYLMPAMQRDTPDTAQPSAAGDFHDLNVEVMEWDCPDLPAFFDTVFTRRAQLTADQTVPRSFPFSASFDLIEDHYNRESWSELLGLYNTDCSPGAATPFQTGWCGGMIANEALLASSSPLTRDRVLRSLEIFLGGAPTPCGLFHGNRRADGAWVADFAHDTAHPHCQHWTLVRRQGDALWYILRQISLLEGLAPDFRTPPAWDESIRNCARFFAGLWQAEGQFGHFLHQQSGEILVDGSCSGAILPAALITAWRRYQEPALRDAAVASARYFAETYLARGYTTGGPGDALQNPDSESVAALVESYAALHDATGDEEWLRHGTRAAALASSWVMPYNFPFPSDSEFGRLGITTRGSVFANTQNKHAAPGICNHSGEGLLRLFRATGDLRLLDLLTEIARFIPQTISRADRPIHDKGGNVLPPGWINERVNTSDWDDNLGGVFKGSCWCEVAMLLTAAGLPGIYARPDTGLIRCLDHVQAEWTDNTRSTLRITNPTPFPARVRVMVEPGAAAAKPLPLNFAATLPLLHIPPGESRIAE
ncbi:MAG: hypothetical protein LAT83_05295 [Kiritimatiellae bacterium]|nr:hypothetical protein [Kiritimatiellia bacterium]